MHPNRDLGAMAPEAVVSWEQGDEISGRDRRGVSRVQQGGCGRNCLAIRAEVRRKSSDSGLGRASSLNSPILVCCGVKTHRKGR